VECFAGEVADEAGDGEGEDPGPDDAGDDAPFDGAQAFGGANAHDRRGDDVGGGERDAEVGRAFDDGGGGGLGGEAVDGLQFHHLVAHRFDDAPAAAGGAGGHHEGAGDHDPAVDFKFGGLQEAEPVGQVFEGAGLGAGEEREGDDAHGFLGVVGAMGKSHPGRAHNLQLAEVFVDEVRRGAAQQGVEQIHEDGGADEADDRRGEHGHDNLGPEAGGLAFDHLGPVHDGPVSIGGGQGRAAESADERVAGGGGQAEPPGEEVPGDRADERGQNRGHGDGGGIDEAAANGLGDGGAHHGAEEVEERGHHDGLARGEHLGRDDRGDGVGGVVEAVDVFEHQGREQNDQEKRHGTADGRLGVFQHDLENDGTGIAAAVHGFLHHLEEFLEDHGLLGVIRAVVEIFDEAEHDLVGLAFGELQAFVGLLNGVELGALAELFDHEHDGVGGLAEQGGLALEALGGDAAGVDGEAFDDFLDDLGDAVEGVGKGFDVFAFERGDEGFAEFLGDLLGDALVLAAALDELVEVIGGGEGLAAFEVAGQQLGAGERFFCAGFKKVVELLVFTEEFFERKHG
jgi:hypothetical protein